MTIRAGLTGSSTASACGIVAQGGSPVLALCRRLVAAGHDPATPLEAYRGATLCLRIRSIGEAAGLRVNAEGTGFMRWSGPSSEGAVRSPGLPAISGYPTAAGGPDSLPVGEAGP
jgi:hypothetical protein